ncbi:MAG: phosphopantothenoylcysteine decarboxylase [Spirochaetes bacterium]|nr:phosphopantothenoylcysteine decarboxylase [Spirochaetota bacterium]
MPLKDKKIIVTGGPTREWIDPVRYISNASSGKMGIALADAAVSRSKQTVFIHGPIENSLLTNTIFKSIYVETTADLMNAVLNELTPGCVIIMAAAPADFQPEKKSSTKIKKENDTDILILKLKKNPDILKNIAEKKSKDASLSGIFVTGFAAETDNTESNAIKKFNAKNLDMICLNDVTQKDAGFGTDTNRIIIFTKDSDGIKKTELPLLLKAEAAERILDLIESELK